MNFLKIQKNFQHNTILFNFLYSDCYDDPIKATQSFHRDVDAICADIFPVGHDCIYHIECYCARPKYDSKSDYLWIGVCGGEFQIGKFTGKKR